MALKHILKSVKNILVAEGYASDQIILQNIKPESKESSLSSAIFIIEESSTPILSNLQFADIAIYIRRPSAEDGNIVAQDIYHKLHGRRGNSGTVTNNNAKINIITALTRPYAYSTITTGSNMVEYQIKFRVQYIDTDFDNI